MRARKRSRGSRAAVASVYAGDDELGGAGLIRVRHQPCVGPTHISLQLSMIQQDLLPIDDGRRILHAVRPHEGESGAVLVGGATGSGAQLVGLGPLREVPLKASRPPDGLGPPRKWCSLMVLPPPCTQFTRTPGGSDQSWTHIRGTTPFPAR